MHLKNISYVEYRGTKREWALPSFSPVDVNLIVGKNASGKSRVISTIVALAQLLDGSRKLEFASGEYSILFEEEGQLDTQYHLAYHNAKVTSESLIVGERQLLTRGADGIGRIHAQRLACEIDFQAPQNELAAVARRDSIQHPFFEPLNEWAKGVLFYPFGTPLGREQLGLFSNEQEATPVNLKAPNEVVPVFRAGEKTFGPVFVEAIKADMRRLGYSANAIGLKRPEGIKISAPVPGELLGLYVHESDLGGATEQLLMSQGMFRAFSLCIQLNYMRLAKRPTCVLIDDIGEGLDYDRSCRLIHLVMDHVKETGSQLIMTTNDRFVMNAVPLEKWALIDRVGGQCNLLDYRNSKEIFDEFKMTGLNNFDFLASDFAHSQASTPDED